MVPIGILARIRPPGMLLSSADILKILSRDAIIREAAQVKIVDDRPGLDAGDKVYIYIQKYPTIADFEATWKIWVRDNSNMGEYVLRSVQTLLPKFEFEGDYYTTTDFASSKTVVKTQEEIDREVATKERQQFKKDFRGLQEGLEERLGQVRDGIDGKDGKDGLMGPQGAAGRDGRDGRDGKDLEATEVELFDLKNVDEGIPLTKGQVLTWDGTQWTNLYVRQSSFITGGGSSDSSGGSGGDNGGSGPGDQTSGIPEAPLDGNYYVRQNGKWINLESALGQLGFVPSGAIDGGDFTNDDSDALSNVVVDGGEFTPAN